MTWKRPPLLQLVLTALAIVALAACAADAAPVVVVSGNGDHYVMSDGTPPRLEGPVQLIRLSGDTPTPGPGDTQSVAAKVAALSRAVPDKAGAAAIAAVVGKLAEELDAGRLSAANAERGYEAALTVTLSSIGSDAPARWATWRTGVKALAGGGYTAPFFRQVQQGLATAHGLDLDVLGTLADVAQLGTEAAAAADLAEASLTQAQVKEAAFDFTAIITLIMQILQLLRDLGILGG